MSTADNENNENMCKQLLMAQGGDNLNNGDVGIGATAAVTPSSGDSQKDAEAMEVQMDQFMHEYEQNPTSHDRTNVMPGENIEIPLQRKRKKSDSLDKNSGAQRVENKLMGDSQRQAKDFEQSSVSSSSPVRSGTLSSAYTSINSPSASNKTIVSELKDQEHNLNESSDDDASWEMAPDSLGAEENKSLKKHTEMRDKDSELYSKNLGIEESVETVRDCSSANPQVEESILASDNAENGSDAPSTDCPVIAFKNSNKKLNCVDLDDNYHDSPSRGSAQEIHKNNEFEPESDHPVFKSIPGVADDNQNLLDGGCEEKYKLLNESSPQITLDVVTSDNKADVLQESDKLVPEVILGTDRETRMETSTTSVEDSCTMDVAAAKDPLIPDANTEPAMPVLGANLEARTSGDDKQSTSVTVSVAEVGDSGDLKELESDTVMLKTGDAQNSAMVDLKAGVQMPVNDSQKSGDGDKYFDEDADSTNQEEEDSWDALFDDSGDCLDSHLMDEVRIVMMLP
jgi:hypothetical protein